MKPPSYAGNAYLSGPDLWHGSRCRLNDLPCGGHDCRTCDLAKMAAAEALSEAVQKLTDAMNMNLLARGGQ